MKSINHPMLSGSVTLENTGLVERFSRKLVLAQLKKLCNGRLVIRENSQTFEFGDSNDTQTFAVYVDIVHPSAWVDIAFGGSCGAGEAYIKGSWTCPQLLELLRLFLKNRDMLNRMDRRLTGVKLPFYKMIQWLRRNNKSGSRRNISAHYDLGNDFFRLFLDSRMMYSSAIYPTEAVSLEQAAEYKLEHICRKLQLQAEDHLLEIGTGWGGFAIYAASRFNCRVTTTTISREQFEFAAQRIKEAGLEDKITLLNQDYRDLQGRFDKLVSIEMIEAIGHQYMDTYFRQCNTLLRSGGKMLLQAITIADQQYKYALRELDFIKKFVFPGGFLPSITAMSESICRSSDLNIFHLEDIGLDYARTLSDWRQRFYKHYADIRARNYSDAFIRLWEFYFCYCEAGFLERDISTVQIVLTKENVG